MKNFISKTEYIDDVAIMTFNNNVKVKPQSNVCAHQIAEAILEKTIQTKEEKDFIAEIEANQHWLEYATIVLSEDNLRNEFGFLMKKYFKELKENK